MSSLYSFYKNTPGLQVKRDMDFSNVTIQCDPRLVVPDTPTTQTSGIFKKDTAGKIAVAHDICDLNVSNLTVNGIAEVCDIVCPVDFNLTAGNNINETAAANMNLNATGLLAADGSINLTSSANTTGTGGQIVLTAGATTNNFNNSGVEVNGNNAAPTTNTAADSGASLNVFPRVARAKGLSVVTFHDTAGEHAIAADLTGTTILRADGPGSTTGATGHLIFAPARDLDPSLTLETAPVGSSITFDGAFAADACGRITIRAGGAGLIVGRLTFAKEFPSNVLNVFLMPTNVAAAELVAGPAAQLHISNTNFTYFEVSFIAPVATTANFNYFVVDAVAPATQIG